MSHDINNMNQAMMGYLEMAIELPGFEGKDKELVEKPLEIIGHSSKLIDNVKKLRRLEAGEVPPRVLDLGEVLSQVRDEYRTVHGRDVAVNYSPAAGCLVDANELLTDVFSNLVGNSIKHSQGPLTINILLKTALWTVKNIIESP